MLTGRRFKLERSTLAVGDTGDKRATVTVPIGSILKVVADPDNGHGMVDVLWEGRLLEMFAVDVDVRGTEIEPGTRRDLSAKA